MAGACARLKGRRANSSACSGQLEEKELVPFICLFVTSHPSFVTHKKRDLRWLTIPGFQWVNKIKRRNKQR